MEHLPATQTTQLLSQSLAPQELDKHRARIGVRVEAMLHGYWKDTPSPLVKDEIMRQWMNTLHNYGYDEIDKACSQHVMDNPSRKPNEGHIRQIIIANRGKDRVRQPVASTEEPPREKISPEKAAEMAAEFKRVTTNSKVATKRDG